MQWLIDIISKLCNAYTDQAILDAKVIPAGTIILWSAGFPTIPDGWTACDGTDGTPDLRYLFVRSAGNGHAPHEVGGSNTHIHGIGGGLESGVTANDEGSSVPPFHTLWYIQKL